MLGGTAGRTTLNGEGLQHEDGHSHVLFSVVPNCRAYDPAFGYEAAVIIHDGLRRMFSEQEDAFYYLTLMNENYRHPPIPDGAREGILKGMYLLREGPKRSKKPRVQLLGSGTILNEVIAAADLLAEDFDVVADVWSVTSFTELRRDGIEVERWNMLHPLEPPRQPYVTQCLSGRDGPAIAATDYIRAFPDQIRQWVPGPYRVLGTDGFGRSDTRAALRRFFEVDRHYVTVAACASSTRLGLKKRSSATRSTPTLRCRPPCKPGAGVPRRAEGYHVRWKETLVTTIPGWWLRVRRSLAAVRWCSSRCQRCLGTTSGTTTVSVISGRWRCSASTSLARGASVAGYGERTTWRDRCSPQTFQ
jgi:pyruvate dehydrogenase complex dehydrogenase (E1) component